MLILNLTIYNLWGRVLEKFQEAQAIAYAEAQAIAYADDGYIKAKMSVTLQVFAELKYVLFQGAGVELNVSKTSMLPKGVTAQAAFDVAQGIAQATLPRLLTSATTFSSLPSPSVLEVHWYRCTYRY